MKDIYSPSQTTDDVNSEPIPMPAGTGEVPELNFDIPSLDETKKLEDFDPGFYGRS